MSIGSMSHAILRNGHVTLSNLRVKGHLLATAERTLCIHVRYEIVYL